MVAILLVGYEIDFSMQIWLEILKRAFGDTNNLPIPSLIQQLFDVAIVLVILDIDRRIEVMSTINIRLVKDPTNLVLA